MAVHSADKTRIAFDAEGDGPPLILVTGAFCDRSTPQELSARLASTFTVIRYDRRGRGRSSDTFPWDVEREIEDLEAMIEVAGGSAFVYGHSSGASLALYAAAHGSAITKLVAYEPPFSWDPDRAREMRNLQARLEELLADKRRDDMAELFLTRAVGVPKEGIAAIKEGPHWQGMRALAHTLPYDVALGDNQAMPADTFTKIQVPTLLVAGGNSPAWARTAIETLAREIPNSETLILEGQDHGVSDDVIAPVLEKFFS